MASITTADVFQRVANLDKYVVHCRKKKAYDVYIGRKSKGAPKDVNDFSWGNPFVMRGNHASERKRVIQEYTKWLIAQPELVKRIRRELKGKTLACWCAPKDCHGHVLAWVANSEPMTYHLNALCQR